MTRIEDTTVQDAVRKHGAGLMGVRCYLPAWVSLRSGFQAEDGFGEIIGVWPVGKVDSPGWPVAVLLDNPPPGTRGVFAPFMRPITLFFDRDDRPKQKRRRALEAV